MVEASFSRESVVSNLKITGTLVYRGSAAVTQSQIDDVLNKAIAALDSSDFYLENLQIKAG